MKLKTRMNLLGIYDLILAAGYILSGVLMIAGKGVFAEYPKEWSLTGLPFESWAVPGFAVIIVPGIGNVAAAVFSFRKANSISWIASAAMGLLMFAGLIAQIAVLNEMFLATAEFMFLSLVQVFLSGYVYLGYRRCCLGGHY